MRKIVFLRRKHNDKEKNSFCDFCVIDSCSGHLKIKYIPNKRDKVRVGKIGNGKKSKQKTDKTVYAYADIFFFPLSLFHSLFFEERKKIS